MTSEVKTIDTKKHSEMYETLLLEKMEASTPNSGENFTVNNNTIPSVTPFSITDILTRMENKLDSDDSDHDCVKNTRVK